MMPIAALCGHSSEVLAWIATFGREAPVFGAQYIPTANGPSIKHFWVLSFWHAMCILHMAQALYISEFYHFDTQCVYYIWPMHYTFLSFIILTRSVHITYGPSIIHFWILSFWYAMCILHMPKDYTFLSFIILTHNVYITYGSRIIHFWVLSFWYAMCILHMAQALYISEFYHFDTQCVYYIWSKHYIFLSFRLLTRNVHITEYLLSLSHIASLL